MLQILLDQSGHSFIPFVLEVRRDMKAGGEMVIQRVEAVELRVVAREVVVVLFVIMVEKRPLMLTLSVFVMVKAAMLRLMMEVAFLVVVVVERPTELGLVDVDGGRAAREEAEGENTE